MNLLGNLPVIFFRILSCNLFRNSWPLSPEILWEIPSIICVFLRIQSKKISLFFLGQLFEKLARLEISPAVFLGNPLTIPFLTPNLLLIQLTSEFIRQYVWKNSWQFLQNFFGKFFLRCLHQIVHYLRPFLELFYNCFYKLLRQFH